MLTNESETFNNSQISFVSKPFVDNSEQAGMDINEALQLKILCIEFNGRNYAVTLNYYPNPSDQSGFYWKTDLNTLIDITEPCCASLYDDLKITIPGVEYEGKNYAFTLEYYVNIFDTTGLYWKMDISTFTEVLLKSKACTTIGNDLTLTVPCIQYAGISYQIVLRYYNNPFDLSGLFWKLESINGVAVNSNSSASSSSSYSSSDIDDDGDGYSENQGDCNDGNNQIYPGADEIYNDGIDQNCNGKDDSFEIANNVRVLSESTLDELIQKADDYTVLTFSKNANEISQLKTGDIIVSGVEQGFLRRVVSIEDTGDQIILYTTNATLVDVFRKCSIQTSLNISPDNVEQFIPLIEGVTENLSRRRVNSEGSFSLKLNTTGFEGIQVEGNVNFKYDVKIELDIDWDYWNTDVKKLIMEASTEEFADIKLKSEDKQEFLNIEKPIAMYRLKPYTVLVGYVPVVVVPVIVVNFKLAGNSNIGFEYNFSAKLNQSVKYKYENGQWFPPEPSGEPETPFGNGPKISLNAELKASVGPSLELLLYGLVGTSIDAGIYGKGKVDLASTPWWEVKVGMEASPFKVSFGNFKSIF